MWITKFALTDRLHATGQYLQNCRQQLEEDDGKVLHSYLRSHPSPKGRIKTPIVPRALNCVMM